MKAFVLFAIALLSTYSAHAAESYVCFFESGYYSSSKGDYIKISSDAAEYHLESASNDICIMDRTRTNDDIRFYGAYTTYSGDFIENKTIIGDCRLFLSPLRFDRKNLTASIVLRSSPHVRHELACQRR